MKLIFYLNSKQRLMESNTLQGRRNDFKSGGVRLNEPNKVGDKVGILPINVGYSMILMRRKMGVRGLPLEKFLQTTPFKLRENDTTPSYYA